MSTAIAPRRAPIALAFAALAVALVLLLVGSGRAYAYDSEASIVILGQPDQPEQMLNFDSADGSATAHLAVGGIIHFGYPIGNSTVYNIIFDGPQPTSCVRNSPDPGVPGPAPFPSSPEGWGWQGDCTFNTSGVYPFHTGGSARLEGVITVGDPAKPPVTSPTLPTAPSDLIGGLELAPTQIGKQIVGRFSFIALASTVTVSVSEKSWAMRASATKPVPVGSLKSPGLATNSYDFAVKLNKKAIASLRMRRKLGLKVTVRIDRPGFAPAQVSKPVTLKLK